MTERDPISLVQMGAASPASFARVASRGTWQLAPHLAVLNYYLLLVFAGQIKRLMIFMPPRHGKSALASHYFPAWWIGMRPHERVLLASYEAQFAATWGRAARNTLVEYGPDLFGILVAADSKAMNRWNVEGTTGGMVTAGVGGSITGRGGELLLLDDPIKNDEAANSPGLRQKQWEWWRATWRTRLQKGGAMVHIQTRWHEDDLAGRILQQAADTNEHWEVLNLPAVADEVEDDVLGWHREPGQPLWPEMFDAETLQSIERDVGSHWWNALYQQRPVSLGGGIFKRQFFRYWHGGNRDFYTLMTPEGLRKVSIASCSRFLTVDPAASTSTSADYTAIAAWALTPQRELILLDMERIRMEGPDQPTLIRQMADRWKVSQIKVEAVAYQLTLFQTLRRMGLPVTKLSADKDKTSRALVAAARLQSGDIYFPQAAAWLGEYESELLAFPRADHDDMVDATSYAAIEVAKNPSVQLLSW